MNTKKEYIAMTGKTPQNTLLAAFDDAFQNSSLVKITLGHYTGSVADLQKILGKKVQIKGEDQLSLTYRYKTRDVVKNLTRTDGLAEIKRQMDDGFHAATLMTTEFDLTLDHMKDGTPRLKRTKPTHQTPPATTHNREKQRPIEAAGQTYLHALGITDDAGHVYKNGQDKFRQINRYVEILSHLLRDLDPACLKKVVDMGAGKGYLTFALADYLAKNFSTPPDVIGVEYRADLVDLCNRIATESHLPHLRFEQGSIADFDSSNTNILIALHACDTATDDAIFKGIQAGADLIVVAPCCHKQIRREMEQAKPTAPMDTLLRHGTFLERQAEMVTDGLRAMLLEYCGYNTKVFEFISDSHTPKNVLVVGLRDPKRPLHDPETLKKIEALKGFFGIKTHHLQSLLIP